MLHTNRTPTLGDFVESYGGSDIFVRHDSDGQQCYCIRHSSADSDYTNDWAGNNISTLDQARDIARVTFIGRWATQEPPIGWR